MGSKSVDLFNLSYGLYVSLSVQINGGIKIKVNRNLVYFAVLLTDEVVWCIITVGAGTVG